MIYNYYRSPTTKTRYSVQLTRANFKNCFLANPYHEAYDNPKDSLFAITDGKDREESSKLDNILL
jgi:hypothetical protein